MAQIDIADPSSVTETKKYLSFGNYSEISFDKNGNVSKTDNFVKKVTKLERSVAKLNKQLLKNVSGINE